MRCALCHEDRELRRSHIIPEFLHAAMYDETHRFWVVSADESQRNAIKQKGEWERLLCEACEDKFGKVERYASLILKGGLPFKANRDGNLIFIEGIDYSKFKLFQLSILWRASVSSRPLFEEVTLGPYEEQARQLLLRDDPGDPTEFGCVMWGITLVPGKTPGLIMQPVKARIGNLITYKFVFGGFVWAYVISKNEPKGALRQCMLDRDGRAIIQVRGVEEMEDLSLFMAKVQKQGKLAR